MSDLVYRSPVPGVAVILLDGAKIALVKRMGSEKWSIPCGCIEYGESFVNAAVREVKEEIGIDSEPSKIINVASNIWSSNKFYGKYREFYRGCNIIQAVIL